MPEERKEESNCNADRSFVTPAPFTYCSALLHRILCANGSDDADSCDHTQSTHEQGRARQANEEVWRDLQVGGGGRGRGRVSQKGRRTRAGGKEMVCYNEKYKMSRKTKTTTLSCPYTETSLA